MPRLRDDVGLQKWSRQGCHVTCVAISPDVLATAAPHPRERRALLPESTQQAAMGAVGDEEVREVARRYSVAWESGDVDTIIAMLTDDARYSMPPLTAWYAGRDDVRRFLLDLTNNRRGRFRRAYANGRLAFATYAWDETRASTPPWGWTSCRSVAPRSLGRVISGPEALRDVRPLYGDHQLIRRTR